ncbi:MAG: helix-hairpin-helix domain-containing protein [Firmicutes bacterium]|nr:helix-hairpin-helix domain-containing protein [Bacillota bacterium]
MNFNLDLNRIRLYIEDNSKKVRMAALILIVGLSILFFWIHGDPRTIEIEEAAQGDAAEYEEAGYGEDIDSSVSAAALYVDISGEVKLPGVYKVSSETRVFQVIDMAGGLTDKADTNSLNRAERVIDGQKIIVRAVGEEGEIYPYGSGYDSYMDETGKVNINYATSDILQTLPGIGPSKAQKIISYREEMGYFATIEEIMSVSGIGEKTFASIKDLITV